MLEILDFSADWCGPCKMMVPIIEELEKELGDKVKFTRLNVDTETEMAAKYGVMSVPTLVFLKDNQEIHRIIGYTAKEELLKEINAQI